MALSTKGIELVRVNGPFEWLADRDPQYQHTSEQLKDFEVEWYQQKDYDPAHRDGYVRMWKKGEPCPYEEDQYDLIYAEDYE